MNNQITQITEEHYNQLPFNYAKFEKPKWREPFITVVNNRKIDLNCNNLLSNTFLRINSFDSNTMSLEEAPIYLKSLQGIMELTQNQSLNFGGKSVDFFADTWDFSEFAKKTQHKHSFRYNFSDVIEGVNDYYEIIIRVFMFYLIVDKQLSSSIGGHFSNIKMILKSFYDNGINNLKYLTLFDIKKAIERDELSYTSQYKKKFSLKLFLTIYSYVIEDVITKDIFEYLNDRDASKIKAIVEENKTKLLPTDFFKKLDLVLSTTLESEDSKFGDRMISGLFLVLMQTGLRPSELINLEKNSLSVTTVDNKSVGQIKYDSSKTHYKSTKKSTTIATQKVIDTYGKLIALDKGMRSNLLAFDINGKGFGITNMNVRLEKICLEHCIELGIINHPSPECFGHTYLAKELNNKSIFNPMKKYPDLVNVEDVISIPTLTQFRVYFASEWRAIGVDDRHVSSMLGHTSSEMWGYYARGAGEIQQEREQIETLFSEVVNGEANLLGPKSSSFQEKINKFILRNKFNAETDLTKIIDGLADEVEIRIKSGGFCVHSNKLRACQYDADTDEFMCSYGCCPNHCHTYFSTPVTYSKFQDSVTAIKYNLKNGFERQVEKELKKLKALIILELTPELNDIEVQLKKRSADEIISRHPDTKKIIDNLDSIILEVEYWKKQIEISEGKIKGNS
jgi:integrase